MKKKKIIKFILSLGIESPVFQLQIFGIILFVQDSIFSLPFVSLLFLATRAELLVVKYRHKSRDKESPTKRKKVEHRCSSNSGLGMHKWGQDVMTRRNDN